VRESTTVKRHLPLSLALLLAHATGASLAQAESPLTDPIAPAVIGRPLDQIRPARPSRPAAAEKQAVAKPAPAPARKVARQQAPRPAVAPQKAAFPSTATLGAGPAAALAGSGEAVDRPVERVAKMALDDRADPRTRLDEVGKGTHLSRKRLGPGAYFDDKDRAAVRKYYEANPSPGGAAGWQIGEPVPRDAVAVVPPELRARLPRLPPGHRYVRVGGELVLVASGSGMVVDGISRTGP
jgi:Ni/Co efflux regulator RcnB